MQRSLYYSVQCVSAAEELLLAFAATSLRVPAAGPTRSECGRSTSRFVAEGNRLVNSRTPTTLGTNFSGSNATAVPALGAAGTVGVDPSGLTGTAVDDELDVDAVAAELADDDDDLAAAFCVSLGTGSSNNLCQSTSMFAKLAEQELQLVYTWQARAHVGAFAQAHDTRLHVSIVSNA